MTHSNWQKFKNQLTIKKALPHLLISLIVTTFSFSLKDDFRISQSASGIIRFVNVIIRLQKNSISRKKNKTYLLFVKTFFLPVFKFKNLNSNHIIYSHTLINDNLIRAGPLFN